MLERWRRAGPPRRCCSALGCLAAQSAFAAHLLPPGGRADRHFVGQQLTITARPRAGRGVGDGGAVRLALLIGAAGLLGGAGPGNQRTRQQQGQNKQKGTPHNCSSSWTGGLGHDLLSTTSWSQPLGRDASARWQATPAD